jgi:hypothetical protein
MGKTSGFAENELCVWHACRPTSVPIGNDVGTFIHPFHFIQVSIERTRGNDESHFVAHSLRLVEQAPSWALTSP